MVLGRKIVPLCELCLVNWNNVFSESDEYKELIESDYMTEWGIQHEPDPSKARLLIKAKFTAEEQVSALFDNWLKL